MIPHDKLFIPGPVEVSEKTWAAFSRPMIGHRGEDFKNLYRAIHPGLQTLFGTKQPVFLSTSSAWGVMEASDPEPGRSRSALLHVRRVLGQMVRGGKALWQGGRTTPGRLGKTYRSKGDRQAIGHGKIRHCHPRPQRDVNRRDESAPGNLLHCSPSIPM